MFEVFEMVKLGISKDEVRIRINGVLRDLTAETEASVTGRLSDWERNEQLYSSTEVMVGLREQRACGNFGAAVHEVAVRALAPTGTLLGDLSPDRRDDILDGAARALIERERLLQLRTSDRLAEFVPVDPLFRASPPGANGTSDVLGPTLGEAISEYLETKGKSWTAKTHRSRVSRLSFLQQHFGAERLLATITTADVRTYRDAVIRLRRNSGHATQTFLQRQAANAAHRISDTTAALVFVPTQAFFRWCRSEQGYVDHNPAENIKVAVSKRTKGRPKRRPFSAEELTILFSAPVFTGCQSFRRLLVKGSREIRNAHFWIPILGFYCGARVGELVQLHLTDVYVDGDIPYLHITEDGAGPPGSDSAKHVKSEAGVRKIPLHPDVMGLGFAEFVSKRRRDRRSKRLFFEIKMGADGQASTVYSKWFGRLMDAVGLSDPALVFHSLRHNAEDAFRDALVPQYVIDKVIGHDEGTTSGGYGHGVSLEVMYNAVKAMRHKVSVLELLEAG
nr:site-specific integrase [Sphingomonas sp. CCH9-F2]